MAQWQSKLYENNEVCPESIQPHHMKNRDISWKRYKIQETVYTGQGCLSSLQSRHLGTSQSSLIIVDRSLYMWTFSGALLVAGLPECGSLSTDSQPSLKHLCHTFIYAALIASSLKAFWFIWIVSTEECSGLTQNLMQTHSSTHSVILNARATQCTCSLNGMYHPHWLVQWSHHCSRMHIPFHFLWLSGYMDVMQTLLIILTMAGLFLDRPHIHLPHFSEQMKKWENHTEMMLRDMWVKLKRQITDMAFWLENGK